MSDSDDDQPQLSSDTLAALEEFLKEKEQNLLKCISDNYQVAHGLFDEDWQLSQFWYDDKTIEAFVKGALNSTPTNGKIALISCPTIYSKLKADCGDRQVTLFEYDDRFKMFGTDFIQYDYNLPLNVPKDMIHEFDLVIADPPFLSDECLTKIGVTIKLLGKKNIVLCTGAIMEELVNNLMKLKKCKFVPCHKNNLANEFCCYSNFDFDKTLE